MLLELCAYNIQSCLIAEGAGAGRIELCADPAAGGTSPSFGLVEYCLERLSIPVFPMVRPRGGNFLYDSDEIEIMKRDIHRFREMGCKGIATGCHGSDRRIDVELLKRLVDWAGPMEVTCHKVFDRVPDANEALEAVISTGCSRILTSGLAATSTEGAETLAMLRVSAQGRIIIMPGGGVRSGNLRELVKSTGCTEFHSSGIIVNDGSFKANKNEVMEMVSTLQSMA
ncbi:MAG: copper homeostasis protein CutC [Taibaiella sp.]|nr:copper homeostasis protein CutC [Taibaiella sp.]